MIRFEIVGVYGDSAEVDVLGVQCGGSIPESYDETVTVYDALGCLLVGEDEEALIGVRGYATRIRDVASGECRWEIISLCCPSGD